MKSPGNIWGLGRFASAVSWSVGAELTSKAIQPLVYLVLATVLSPSDFGVVAGAMVVVSFADVFWQAGLGKALVQTHANVKVAASSAFVLMLGLSGTVALLLFLSSSIIANDLLSEPAVADPIRLLCIYIFFSSVVSVPVFVLTRDMQFKQIFFVRMISIVCPMLVSVPLAFAGYGFWSLVIATIAAPILQAIYLLILGAFPSIHLFSYSEAKKLLNFGKWVMLSGLLSWFYAWGDALVVSTHFSTHELGIYRIGSILVFLVFGALFSPLLPVIYSQLSIEHRSQKPLGETFQAAFNIITSASIPVAAALLMFSPFVEGYILGDEWQGVGFVFASIATMVGFATISSANGEAYRAMGRPRLEAVITGSLFIPYILTYIVTAPFGLETFVIARTILGVLALGFHLYFAQRVGLFRLSEWAPIFAKVISVSGLAVVGWSASRAHLSDEFLTELILFVGFSALMVLALIVVNSRQLLRDAKFLLAEK